MWEQAHYLYRICGLGILFSQELRPQPLLLNIGNRKVILHKINEPKSKIWLYRITQEVKIACILAIIERKTCLVESLSFF